MAIKEEQLCRLCLNVAENDFEVIEEITREMLQVLLLRINLDVTENPIMCQNCSNVVKKFYNFKSLCTVANNVKFELKEEWKDEGSGDENSSVCRFCMNPQTGDDVIAVNVLINEPLFGEAWPTVMPEVDINIVKNFIICIQCKENLECYIKFVRNCWDTEERINTYRQHNGTNSEGKVNLRSVQQLFTEGVSNYTDERVVKQEADVFKYEELHIKEEASCLNDNACQSLQNTGFDLWNNTNGEHKRTIRNGPVKMYKCALCIYQTKYKANHNKHILIHKDISEVETYKCALCTYQAKRKTCLKKHMIIHKNISEVEIYKCELCIYKTKFKANLKKHLLIHKDTSEVPMYKCALCIYQTKHKRNLEEHVLIHKNNSEVETHKCTLCAYETKRKSNFKRHTLIHKDNSEIKTYKCALCIYEAKHRTRLEDHMLIHKDTSEVEMFKCAQCNYETKRKASLKLHMLIHKDPSEVEMYKCPLCRYETKRKSSLRLHMINHKDISEVEMYKCALCVFETKKKGNLKNHMKTHMGSSVGIHKEK